jgi:dipeptidyl aminopeptidase/acylaminoacyl peptidase
MLLSSWIAGMVKNPRGCNGTVVGYRNLLPPVVLALATCVPFPIAAASAERPLALDDYYQLHNVSDLELSADGRWVAYTLSTPNKLSDSDDGDIWLARYDGSEHLQLTRSPANDRSPHFSADGRWLAFLRDPGDGKTDPQIWLIDLRGGEARQLSHFDGKISSFAFAPDGQQIAFAAQATRSTTADGDKPSPILIKRLQFKQDGYSYLREERSHLYALEIRSGLSKALTDGSYNELQPAWSPDGSLISFISKRGAEPDETNNWDVYVMPAQVGAAARQITRNPGTEGDPDAEWGTRAPQFSPDGRQLTYEAGGKADDAWFALEQLGLANVAGDLESTPAATLDRNCIDPKFSHDGRFIYFRLEDDRSMVLARLRLSDGSVERLSPSGHVVSEFDVGADGHTVLIDSRADQPGEVYALEAGRLRALSEHNAALLAEVKLQSALPLDFKSKDGLGIGALFMAPAGTAPPNGWPTLVRLHGGPVAQHQNEFDFAWQLFAAAGYAVLAPNPRGSSGRGYAFQKKLFAKWGLVDVADVLAAVDYAVAHKLADPRRLGVGGWSYGSILTNYVIASDRRFRAATSGAGMSNMLAGYGTDQYVREWEVELGLPWMNTPLWLKVSYPFLHADRITTPTLFMGGDADSNVPLIGAQQMYQALRRLHVPTELIIYPGQYHALDRPNLRVDRIARYLAWYDTYLRHDGAAATAH